MKTGKVILKAAEAMGGVLALLGAFFVLDGLLVPKSVPVSIWPEVLLGIGLLAIGSAPFLVDRVLFRRR